MQHALQAYSNAARNTVDPREREASLLLKAASQLQNIKDSWSEEREPLHRALHYNRKLWSVFVSSVGRPENPLPREVKNNIASLGLFIFVLNALMLWLTAALSDALGIAFRVNGFVPALLGGLVIAIVSTVLNVFVGDRKKKGK